MATMNGAQSSQQAVPTDILQLATHDNFWWLYQTKPKALEVLDNVDNIRTLINVVCGYEAPVRANGVLTQALAGDMPVKRGPYFYVNPNPGAYVSTYLVSKGADTGSEFHKRLFCACQALLSPACVQVPARLVCTCRALSRLLDSPCRSV